MDFTVALARLLKNAHERIADDKERLYVLDAIAVASRYHFDGYAEKANDYMNHAIIACQKATGEYFAIDPPMMTGELVKTRALC